MKLSFKHSILVILLLSVIPAKYAEGQIQGSIKDNNNQPVSFANVILLNAEDSSIVSGLMATDEGTYSITNFKPGKYIIGVSIIGYKQGYSQPIVIESSNEHIHNDPIFVESVSQQLEDVQVVAKKPIYELKMDRMVVNVENSVTSTGNTALEVLEKSPGVVVDRQNDGLSLAGKSGVILNINGKRNRMPIAAAVQMLDAMSADNVKRIELITSPPAKYDAEGNAGIINIVLKKNEDFGTNGSFNLGAGVATREKMQGSLNLNHHVDKVNYFGSYSVNFNNSRRHIEALRRFNRDGAVLEINNVNRSASLRLFQNVRMGFDYTISSKTILSFLGSGYIRDTESDGTNKVFYTRNQQATSESDLKRIATSKWFHGMGNVNLEHHFKEDEILSINLDYLNYHNENPSDYTLNNVYFDTQSESEEKIEVTKVTPLDIIVGMVDYSRQVNPKLKIEFGLKETITLFKNDVGVSFFGTDGWYTDPDLTNKYSMNENVSAVYSSFSYEITKKTSVVAGLRYEYMNSVLDSETEKGIVDLHYGELFPSIYLSQKLAKDNTLQFSYNRRIQRPTFNQLAPFIIFLSPDSYVAGNEKLLPAFSNIYKTDFQHKRLILSATFTDTKNSISRFQPQNNENDTKQYFVSRNMDHVQTGNVMIAFPFTINEWWTMQNNFSWIHRRTRSEYDGTELDYSRSSYSVKSIQSLSVSDRLSAEVAGDYTSKSIWGIYEARPRGRIDIGVQWKLKNENSRFSLNVTDVFKTNIHRSVADVPELNIYTKWRLDFEPRVARLTFSHNFGNTALKTRKRKTGSEEERSRVGGE